MKRHSAITVKVLLILGLVVSTTALGTRQGHACSDCMLVWISGEAVAGCYQCGHLGRASCEPAGSHCDMGGPQCDPQADVPAPVCPPQN